MTVFNTASISPAQVLGQDGQNPAGPGNPLTVALDTASASVLSGVVLNFSAPGTATVVTGSGSFVTNVYRLLLTNTTATSITFRNGTTPLTGDMSYGANGSIVLDYSGVPWFTTGAGANFNISISTTSQISGRLYYTQG